MWRAKRILNSDPRVISNMLLCWIDSIIWSAIFNDKMCSVHLQCVSPSQEASETALALLFVVTSSINSVHTRLTRTFQTGGLWHSVQTSFGIQKYSHCITYDLIQIICCSFHFFRRKIFFHTPFQSPLTSLAHLPGLHL